MDFSQTHIFKHVVITLAINRKILRFLRTNYQPVNEIRLKENVIVGGNEWNRHMWYLTLVQQFPENSSSSSMLAGRQQGE